ncbi:MAG: hypothetical protein ABFS32_08410 [Bacteroidota bacterium]
MKKDQTTSNRKRIDIVILSLSIVALIVAIHQTVTNGFGESYWIYMISISLILYHQVRRAKKKQEDSQPKLNRRAKRYMDRHG